MPPSRIRHRVAGRSASISAHPPAASPIACCSAARRACTRWTSARPARLEDSQRSARSGARETQRALSDRPEDLGEPIDLAVCDVSFISATLILPAVAPVLQPDGEMVILVKPQFEAGKGQVGKGGIVREPELHQAACRRVDDAARQLGFETASLIESPILGDRKPHRSAPKGTRNSCLYAHH
jgi:hypothetical protein